MSVRLDVDGVTVYNDTGGGVVSGTGTSVSLSTASAVGRSSARTTGTAAGVGAASGRSFAGFAGFAAGGSTAAAVGVALGQPGSTSHITLVVDSVTVYDAGGGLSYSGQAAGKATVAAIGRSIRAGAGSAAGTSIAHAQGLLPAQGIALAAGTSTVRAGVLRRSVATAFGTAKAGSPLDSDVPPPLTGRSLTNTMAAAIQQPIVRPVIFYEGWFKNGVLNLWSGLGEIVWDQKVWTGTGGLLNISQVEETDQQQASGIVVSLSAVPSSKIALALAEVQRNQAGYVWLGLLDEVEDVIDDPHIIFRGRMDAVSIEDGAESAIIKVSYENEMITLEHARELRYTDQEQQRLFPGDKGLEFIAGLQDKTLRWGSRG